MPRLKDFEPKGVIPACLLPFDDDCEIDEVGDRMPVVNGVYADGSHLAARIARMAERGGASCLLVFPPNSMAMGGQLRPGMALAHFGTIAQATDLPIILFQYPLATGLGACSRVPAAWPRTCRLRCGRRCRPGASPALRPSMSASTRCSRRSTLP